MERYVYPCLSHVLRIWGAQRWRKRPTGQMNHFHQPGLKLYQKTSIKNKKNERNKSQIIKGLLSNVYQVYSESCGRLQEFTGNVKEEKAVSGSERVIT